MSWIVALAAAAFAPLADPALEARAQKLDQEIRCVACKNEPISQSTADIAGDMRRLVRERIEAGESDAEIRDYFTDRYGDFVSFRPPLDGRTWLLWGAPALLALACVGAFISLRGRAGTNPAPEPEEGER